MQISPASYGISQNQSLYAGGGNSLSFGWSSPALSSVLLSASASHPTARPLGKQVCIWVVNNWGGRTVVTRSRVRRDGTNAVSQKSIL
jgi:hypothetical protein